MHYSSLRIARRRLLFIAREITYYSHQFSLAFIVTISANDIATTLFSASKISLDFRI